METCTPQHPAPAGGLGARKRNNECRLVLFDNQSSRVDKVKRDIGHNELSAEGHVVTGVGHDDSCLSHGLADEHRVVAACFIRGVERVIRRPACGEQVVIVSVTGDAGDEDLGLGGPVNQLHWHRPRPIQPFGEVC